MDKSFRHKTSLDDLPAEIIPELASYLDFKDINSLQQTSKKFRESINVPVVLLALAKTYSARHFHIYKPQLRGFDDLTEGELHKWIRKRLVFDRIWKAQTLRPRFRTLGESDHFTLKLVPGGRWLLAGNHDGSVRYYDLDSKELERKALIQSSKDIGGSDQAICELDTYADRDTPGPHFNLAILAAEDRSIEWLHVWQVEIKDGDSLSAKWLTSIPTSHHGGWSYSLAIGRHVVVRTGAPVRDLTAIEIYWWKRCSPTGILRSHFLAPLDSKTMHLIGDGRILCAGVGGAVNLYDIPEPEHISMKQNLERNEDIPRLKPIWSYTLSNQGTIYHSPLYYDGATYRVVASTKSGIWGFTIPTTKGHAPSALQLSPFSNTQTICAPGLYKALAISGNATVSAVRIGYGWERGDDGGAVMAYSRGELGEAPFHGIPHSAFDEESGRFMYDPSFRVIIIDFLDTEY